MNDACPAVERHILHQEQLATLSVTNGFNPFITSIVAFFDGNIYKLATFNLILQLYWYTYPYTHVLHLSLYV